MKKNKILLILDKIFIVYSLLALCLFTFASFYLLKSYNDLSSPQLIKNPEVYSSQIFDANGNTIQKIGQDQGHIKYEELPNVILDAIIAVEDNSYYYHDGVDIHRVFGSIFHNLTSSSSLQGASTITQQLARNLFLNSEKTLARKIKELLLSFSLESTYDKKTILEFYFNRVHFDPVYPGIVYASSKFFNKKVQDLTLVEAATLVGLVQSPSAYEPFKHEEKANNRKNIVLKKMLDMHFITINEYNHGTNIDISSLLYTKPKYEEELPYQAYLDAVYEETVALTNLDPYQDELKIYTYMEPTLQEYADRIQKGEIVDFQDELQQIGGALIKQDKGQVVAIIGGRNYSGRRLFNHASNKKISPASTIKPVFEYLLAIEKLGYHRAKTLNDEQTTYLNGEPLKNAGGHYVGRISFQDALGYSKNTTAINALNELTAIYGEEYLSSYLNSIGLMDKGPYTESYGLGGMKEGVSLINLAASYGIIAGNGEYICPSLIQRIERPDGTIIYEDNRTKTRVVTEETSFIMKEMLINLVDQGYNGLDKVKISNASVGAKTGTGQYDSTIINNYNYPANADKDSLVVGFSLDYCLAVWTGFDKPEKEAKAYFSSSDSRKQITKKIFKAIMNKAANKNLKVNKPSSLYSFNVTKYADDLYLPNEYIPSTYQMMTTIVGYKNIPTYPLPENILPQGRIIQYSDRIEILMDNLLVADKVYEKIYGSLGYRVDYDGEQIFSKEPNIIIYKGNKNISNIKVKINYEQLDLSTYELKFNLDTSLLDIFR